MRIGGCTLRLTKIERIEPKASRCISVDSYDKLFAVGANSQVLTHNSVLQQNIVISALLRPEHWTIIGIDLKRVELTRFRKYGMKVATEVEEAVQFLRFAQAVMMKRYERMEKLGINDFVDLPEPGQALMVLIDEAGELLSPTGAKTDEAKAIDELKGEAIVIIGSIARLGRAAGVHLVIATQRPDASLIPGEIRDNMAVRIGCGPLKPSASTMLFASNIGQRIHSNPKGGIYVQIHGVGNMGQGFYAPNEWLEEYTNATGKEIGLKSKGRLESDLEENTGERKAKFNPLEYWDEDMEELVLGEPGNASLGSLPEVSYEEDKEQRMLNYDEDLDDFTIEESDEYE